MTTVVEVLKAAGFFNVEALVAAASVTDVPLNIAVAFVDAESNGENIYGHDSGGVFYVKRPGKVAVTAANYAEFYRRVIDGGEKSNGVGPMQVTYAGLPGKRGGYFKQAKDQGMKLWLPFDNYRFGLAIIKASLDRYKADSQQLAKVGTLYNEGNLSSGITDYGRWIVSASQSWETRLSGAGLPAVLQRGDSGDDVATLQAGLMLRFPTYAGPIVHSGGADGSFGPATEGVLMEFQRRVSLVPDGLVGSWTRGRLSEYGILPG